MNKKFIELHELAGITISINIKRILYFTTTDDGSKTIIKMNEGTLLVVQESYDEIVELINGDSVTPEDLNKGWVVKKFV